MNDASSEDLGEMKRPSSTKNGAKSGTSTPVLPPPTKRRRSSVPKVDSMDVDVEPVEDPTPRTEDNEDEPPSKKHKSSAPRTNGRSSVKNDQAPAVNETPTVDIDADHAGTLIKKTIERYGKKKNWEDIVSKISTVEQRQSDHKLQIYWTR